MASLMEFIRQGQMQGKTPGIQPVDESRLLELQMQLQGMPGPVAPRNAFDNMLNYSNQRKRDKVGGELADLQSRFFQEQAQAKAEAARQAAIAEQKQWEHRETFKTDQDIRKERAKDNRPPALVIAEAYGQMTDEQRKNFLEASGKGDTSMVVYDADGNPIFTQGVPPGELSRKSKGELESVVLTNEERSKRLKGIQEKVDKYADEYFTYGGAAKAKAGGFLDKAGVPIGKDLQAFNAARSTLLTDLLEDFNAYRKDITGAAAGKEEMASLKKTLANEDMGPDEIRAVMANQIARLDAQTQTRRAQLGYGSTAPDGEKSVKELEDELAALRGEG